ncbi:hypothetical protein KQX54_020168 [Cotesia glomerata]|uniref:Uncharacterized protein n=1 Tax=Cotesia glomerata TaxID=32391 RepID=A0AAV7ICV7_COTGL|nr:hypothetical protein KQX54_020168 [Cotesia glomerata]
MVSRHRSSVIYLLSFFRGGGCAASNTNPSQTHYLEKESFINSYLLVILRISEETGVKKALMTQRSDKEKIININIHQLHVNPILHTHTVYHASRDGSLSFCSTQLNSSTSLLYYIHYNTVRERQVYEAIKLMKTTTVYAVAHSLSLGFVLVLFFVDKRTDEDLPVHPEAPSSILYCPTVLLCIRTNGMGGIFTLVV